MEEKTIVDQLREKTLDVIDDVTHRDCSGSSFPLGGILVEMRKGGSKELVDEGLWCLSFTGKGDPPEDVLKGLFKTEGGRVDTVRTCEDVLEMEDESGFKPVHRYMMSVSRSEKPDSPGWEVGFRFDLNPPDKSCIHLFEMSDTRDKGYRTAKAYLQFSNHMKAMEMLEKFDDFVTERLTNRGYSQEFMSGFRDIVGRLQGMLKEGHHSSWVFSTRSRLEVGRDTKDDDETHGLYKLVLTRSLDPEVWAWVLAIEPVEGTVSVGTPEAHADLIERRTPGGKTEKLVRAEALFNGTRYFGMGLDFAVQAICELDVDDGRLAVTPSVRALQLKLRKMHNEGTPFDVLEGKYPDGAN